MRLRRRSRMDLGRSLAGMGLMRLLFAMSILVAACGIHRDGRVQASDIEEVGAGSDLQAKVKWLIGRLDAPQLAAREQAEKDLVALGTGILPLLQSNGNLSAEASLRLNRVRARLVEQIVSTDALPTRVTCKADGMPLKDVIAQIVQQTGNMVSASPEVEQYPVTWDCLDKTFWEALDGLTRTLNLDWEPVADGGLRVVSRQSSKPRFSTGIVNCGAFRVQLRDLTAVQRGVSELSFVTIDILWEPRLQPAVIWLLSMDIEVTKPGPTPGQKTTPRREIPVPTGKSFVSVALPVEFPSQVFQGAILFGRFEPVLPVGMLDVPFEIAELRQNPRTVYLGEAEITAKLRQLTGDRCEVAIRVRYRELHEAFASHRGWFYSWPVYLEAHSEKFLPKKVELISMSEGGVELLYQFDRVNSSDGRVVCRVPVAIVKPLIEFRLPLPSSRDDR
ncbi:MAG: hypothetical protein ACUVQG_08420 [Thermogutta sp.]